MKNPIPKHVSRAFGPAIFRPRLGGFAVLVTSLLAAANLTAAPEVDTLTGGPSQISPPYYGYEDGDTTNLAQFHTPLGLALDVGGDYLYVADRDNNAVRVLDLGANLTYTFATDGISQPVGVAVDDEDNVYVLNRGNGFNGTVVKFDWFGYPIATNAVGLTNANGFVLDDVNNLYVTVEDTRIIKITPAGVLTTVTNITAAGTLLRGVALMNNGNLAICDAGRHGILVVNPASGAVTNLTGFNGAGDAFGTKANAKFNQPYGIAACGANMLIVTDSGNHRVKVVSSTGTVTNLYGVNSNYWVTGSGTWPGWWDGEVARGDINYNLWGTVEARSPAGVLFAGDGTVYITETYYHLIRTVTGAELPPIPPPPPPPPPVPPPRVGWVDYTIPPAIVVSILRTDQPFIFNNDVDIAIDGTAGAETHFTFGTTGTSIPNPTETVGSTPPNYYDGMFPSQVPPTLVPPQPDLTIKAIGFAPDRQSSYVVTARFQFKTGTPLITGNNPASFQVKCETAGAEMWYTIDGTDPTSNAPSIRIYSPTVSINATNDFTFKVRAFRANYQDSSISTKTFSTTNYIPNRISFGLTNGEPSSRFLARPGQAFYAPVTLRLQPEGETMYSLQFNVAVTNGSGAPAIQNGAGIGFFSMFMSQVEPEYGDHYPPADGNWYLGIPPQTFVFTIGTNGAVVDTNAPVLSTVFVNTNNNLLGVGWLYRTGFRYKFIDPVWPPVVPSRSVRFDTTKQDLISFSIPHDTLFEKADRTVVPGAYSFQVPTNALTGNQYFIQLGSPSGTRDGVGAPGADVYIQAPAANQAVTVTNTAYYVGDVAPFRWFNAGDFGGDGLDNSDVMQVFQSAILYVNMPPTNSDLYLAMDSAGNIGLDSGSGYYTNAGIDYYAAYPVTKTNDFANYRDSYDYFTLERTRTILSTFSVINVLTTPVLNASVVITNVVDWVSNGISVYDYTNYTTEYYTLIHDRMFNGSDQTINEVAFGDGFLDVSDVFVTFRRSLDPALTNFVRLWTNDQFVAVPAPTSAFNSNTLTLVKAASTSKMAASPSGAASQPPSVTFTAGGGVASAGQTVQIPIKAQIQGNYPLRVLGLNLTVQPLDDSPAVVEDAQFSPAPALGLPALSASKQPGNFAATWLNSGIAGLSGSDVVIGTLSFKVPANASANAAYAIHFGHASASPNGFALFPIQPQTGLITLADRSASTWGDGIPDAWRLRYFGSINSILSAATADADGDGAPNSHEFLAGTDPNDCNSFLNLKSTKSGTAPECVIRWPSVAGKRYVLEAAPSLFGPNWTSISTNIGTGSDLECHDLTVKGPRFYRVRVQE